MIRVSRIGETAEEPVAECRAGDPHGRSNRKSLHLLYWIAQTVENQITVGIGHENGLTVLIKDRFLADNEIPGCRIQNFLQILGYQLAVGFQVIGVQV